MVADRDPSRQLGLFMDRFIPACDPSTVVVRCITAVLFCVTLVACRNPFAAEAPVEPGGVLSYMVRETTEEGQESYVLRARVRETEHGLEVMMQTPVAALSIPVDAQLVPIDEEHLPIEYPLVLTSTLAKPGLLWLPDDRRGATESSDVVLHQQWKAWRVVGDDGMPRYYEIQTGLLVDFKLFVGGVRVGGQLISAL